ncbi:MAG: MFS transporter [Candidatus Thorarchaeota archaeon]|jgi:MFS family permease
MHEPCEPFCLDVDGEPDLTPEIRKKNRVVGYFTAFLVVFVLGTTEIFASWYVFRLGGTPLESGIAFGVFGFVYMFSPAIGGRLSDRVGRKKTLLVSTGAYIGVILLYLLPSIATVHLIVIRTVEGFVFGFIAPTIEGMVAELEPESQVATLGNFSTAWSASMILPPLIIAYLAGIYGDLSSLYVILSIEIFSLVIIALFLQAYKRRPEIPENANTQSSSLPTQEKKASKTSPLFIASYLSVMLWGVVSTVILALFPTYIENLVLLGYPFATEDFGNLLLIWNVVRTVGFIIIARLPGEYMKTIILLGASLSAISGFLLFSFIDIWIFLIAMVLSGLGVGFNYLGALYLVVSSTDLEKGAHAGLVESMGGVGLFLGPIVGGWVMDFGLSVPYLMYALLSVVLLLLMAILLRRDNT